MTSALKACLRRNTTADDTGLLGNNMDDGNSKKILSVSLNLRSFERVNQVAKVYLVGSLPFILKKK